MKATQVRLPTEMMDRIDALAGTYGRAQFIREAIEAELARREPPTPAPSKAKRS